MRSLYQQRSINSLTKTVEKREIVLTVLNTPVLLEPFYADETIISVSSDLATNQLRLPEIEYVLYKYKTIKIFNSNSALINFRLITSLNQTFNGSTAAIIQITPGQLRIIQVFNDQIWTIT